MSQPWLRIEVGRDAAADLAEAMAESPSGSLWGRYRKGVLWIEGALPGGIDSPATTRSDGWNRVGIWVRSRTLEPPPNIRERYEKWFPENWHVVLMAGSPQDGIWLFRDEEGSLGPHSHFQPAEKSRPEPRRRLSWVLSGLAGAAGLAGLAAMPMEHRPSLRIEPAGGQQVRVVWNQRAITAAGAQLEIREGGRRRALVIGPLDQGVTWERAGPELEVELRRGDLVETVRAPALP